MTSVKITYKEPEERPIEKVSWIRNGVHTWAKFEYGSLTLGRDDSSVRICINWEDAPEALRAILKMVEQHHG